MIKKLIFAAFIFNISSNSQTIHDIIQPINLQQNQTTKVVISDLFYSLDYSVEFLPNPNIAVGYVEAEKEISLTSQNDFSGISLVSFKLDNAQYEIPVKVVKDQNL